MSFFRQHGWACLFVVMAGVPLAAGDSVVVLPKVMVTGIRDLPPPESWRYAAIPGFEIVSSASDKATMQTIGDFQTFTLVLGIVWPVPQNPGAEPLPIVLCGRSGEFARFVPATAAPVETSQASVSVFLKDKERSLIAVDLQSTLVNINAPDDNAQNAAAGNVSAGMEVDRSLMLRREYVHYLLAQANPRPPAWLEEGLSQLFMGMTYDRTRISLAKVDDPNRAGPADAGMKALSAQQDKLAASGEESSTPVIDSVKKEDETFNLALRHRGLMSFPDLFSVTHDSPTALNPLGSNWAKQCYAFVHLCLYGEHYRYQKGFRQFISHPDNQSSEEFFKQCFGEGYDSMLTELRSYIDGTRYIPVEFDLKKGGPGLPEPSPLALRAATQSEIGRIEGEAFMLAGRQNEARLALTAPFLRGERDPRLLAALGFFELADGGDANVARRSLEAAAAAKSTDPRVCLALARLRFAHYEAKPAGDGGRLSAGQVADVLAVLSIARRLPPALPGVYEQTAETLSQSTVIPTPGDLTVLEEGVRLFPTDAGLVYKTAILESRAGRTENAAVLVALGLKVTAPDTPAHAQFVLLMHP